MLRSGPHDAQGVRASPDTRDPVRIKGRGRTEALKHRNQSTVVLNVFDERPADSQLRAVEQARRMPPGQDERVRSIRVGDLEVETNRAAVKHRLATIAQKKPQCALSCTD